MARPTRRRGNTTFTFIDLFGGIGGARLGLQRAGGRCMFTSEWDRFAQVTYAANFGEFPNGDLRKIPSSAIPEHDLLSAGFPCQPFSLAGVSKKNALNKPTGFEDETQGTLFFEIARVLRDRKPKMFLLENVKNLLHHDKGHTFEVIWETLRKLDYDVSYRVLDAKRVVPQHRERIFIAGFRRGLISDEFEIPDLPNNSPSLAEILDPSPPEKYVLTDHLWGYLQAYAERHRLAGNGFSYGLTDDAGIARTLSARYYKDGAEILIRRGSGNPRRLTPRECARVMGFPDTFRIPVSDTQAYKQFGNAVVPAVVTHVARAMLSHLATQRAPLVAA